MYCKTGRSSVNDSSIFNAPSEFESSIHNGTGFAPIDHVTETSPQRMTPQKFLTGHSIGIIFMILSSLLPLQIGMIVVFLRSGFLHIVLTIIFAMKVY